MNSTPVLQLPQYMRIALSKPLGKLYVSKGKISGFIIDYSVGDVVSFNQISTYRVVDSRVMRVEKEFINKSFCDTYVYNPPGSISLNSITILKTKYFKNICVVGEEDLIVLSIGRDRETTIAYGQPRVGVVIYSSDPIHVLSIIKTFKPTLTFYNTNVSIK